MDSYGSRFPIIPQFKCKVMDSRIVWITAGILTLVKEVWMITDKIEIRKTNWHGWLLTYLTSK